jgi:hypothetical protein
MRYLESYGWREEEIVILCDHKDYSVRQQPTRECILEHLDKLVKLVQKGDFVFFHCQCAISFTVALTNARMFLDSGHGYQTTASKDRWREFDGKDEYIVPMDWWKIRKEAATSGKGKGDDDRPEYILDNVRSDSPSASDSTSEKSDFLPPRIYEVASLNVSHAVMLSP